MTTFKITARNAKQLSNQLDRFNEGRESQLHLNWGKEKGQGTWFAHAEYGTSLKTGLRFDEVVKYVQDMVDAHDKQ